MRGEGREAVESFSAVLRLDPLDPARPQAWAGLACAHNNLGEYDKGCEWARKAVEAAPVMYTFAYLVINAVPDGRMDEARDTLAKMLKIHPAMTMSDALEICHMRDPEWADRVRGFFLQVGLPE